MRVSLPVELWALESRGPQKEPEECPVGKRMKGRKKEGEMKGGGQFQGSECQVLMCLFSITAVPGNDMEKNKWQR